MGASRVALFPYCAIDMFEMLLYGEVFLWAIDLSGLVGGQLGFCIVLIVGTSGAIGSYQTRG
jgi:hypothetical protein